MKYEYMILNRFFLTTALFLVFLSTSCSSVDEELISNRKDPFENTNRKIFVFNDNLDTVVLEPIAAGYNKVIPSYAKTAINNHVYWVGLPNNTINSALQRKWENAAISSLHFTVNALTLGFVNLLKEDEPPHQQDFGQTLAFYGVSEGPYVVVPITGGKTSRHAFAEVINFVINPYSAFTESKTIDQAISFQPVLTTISWRARNFELVNDLKDNCLDAYVRARSSYYQNSFKKIQSDNNNAPSEADSLFDNLDTEG